MTKIAVLGGGSFGTAIANIIATNGHNTYQWMRNKERAAACVAAGENTYYLPGLQLDPRLNITSDLAEAVADAQVVFISIPSGSFRAVAKQVAPLISEQTMVVSTTKGIEVEGFTLMSQILEQELSSQHLGVLSGPNFAKEIVAKQYTGTVVASDSDELLALIPEILKSSTFRVYTNPDRYGVELGGALKNIYAIISGMAAALGVGQNTIAMLLTRSLAEMGRFAGKMGANPMTFLGLAGVGDLILTCTSDLSRNYRVGYAVGKGKNLEQAMADIGQAVEGVNTVKIVKQKSEELGVYMPLVSGLYSVLFDQASIATVVNTWMVAESNSDVEYTGGNV